MQGGDAFSHGLKLEASEIKVKKNSHSGFMSGKTRRIISRAEPNLFIYLLQLIFFFNRICRILSCPFLHRRCLKLMSFNCLLLTVEEDNDTYLH